MKEVKPDFYKEVQLTSSYYKQPNPYVNAPSCNVNLLELSRYAKKSGKSLIDLSSEEVNKFAMYSDSRKVSK